MVEAADDMAHEMAVVCSGQFAVLGFWQGATKNCDRREVTKAGARRGERRRPLPQDPRVASGLRFRHARPLAVRSTKLGGGLTLVASRGTGTVVPCLAVVVMVLGLCLSSASGAVAFEAGGRCVTTSWNPSGRQVQSLEYLFEVRVADAAWSMRVDDLSARVGKRASSDFEELFCDGKDLFHVGHCSDAVRTNLPTRLQFNTYGSVRAATFPANATPIQRILWLAFCSGNYPPLSAANLPPIDNSLMATNVAAVKVDYYTTAPRVPKHLEVWARGVLFPDPQAPQGVRLMRVSGPLQGGYLALEVQSTDPTNTTGGAMVPEHVIASFYGLDLSTEPAKRYRATEIDVSVQSLGAVQKAPAPPALAGAANVLDLRYTNKSGRSFRYLETNGTWVSREDPSAVRTLEAKTKAPVYRVKGDGGKRLVFRWLVVLSLSAPIAFYLMSMIRRRGSTHAENSQSTGVSV